MSGQPKYVALLHRASIGVVLLLAACSATSTPAEVGGTAATGQSGVSPAPARSTATSQSTALPTASPTSAVPSGLSSTLPPGSPLPTESQCAARVQSTSFEIRPDNSTANHSVPTKQQIAGLTPWGADRGMDPRADSLRTQITGDFTGTTDQILEWVACKWGFDPDLVRAEAVVESYWHQNFLGDWATDQSYCPPGTWTGTGCYQSYGMLQIKWHYFQDSWPMIRDDTAFSAEYMYANIRACYEGWTTYLEDRTPLPGHPRYAAGDLWGCVGRWYSGSWYDQEALDYIAKVKTAMTEALWLSPNF